MYIKKHLRNNIHCLKITPVRWCPSRLRHSCRRFLKLPITSRSIRWGILSISNRILLLSSPSVGGRCSKTLLFRYPHKKKNRTLWGRAIGEAKKLLHFGISPDLEKHCWEHSCSHGLYDLWHRLAGIRFHCSFHVDEAEEWRTNATFPNSVVHSQ